MFGSLVKQFALGQSASEADWLIGEGLLKEGFNASALRSMAAPGTAYDDPVLGKDPQPDSMSNYVLTDKDNGGVHINSGIPNHAFYVLSMAMGGRAWEVAGRIWYEAMCHVDRKPGDNFAAFAKLTLAAANRHGESALKETRQAWDVVGVVPND